MVDEETAEMEDATNLAHVYETIGMNYVGLEPAAHLCLSQQAADLAGTPGYSTY